VTKQGKMDSERREGDCRYSKRRVGDRNERARNHIGCAEKLEEEGEARTVCRAKG